MTIAYLYKDANVSEPVSVLSVKITAEIVTAPVSIQRPGAYTYITFDDALTQEQKDALDDFMSARDGIFVSEDKSPATDELSGIGQSPDKSLWKVTVTDGGAVVPVKT